MIKKINQCNKCSIFTIFVNFLVHILIFDTVNDVVFTSLPASTFISMCLSSNHLSLYLTPFESKYVFESSFLVNSLFLYMDEWKSFNICKRQRHMDNLISISLLCMGNFLFLICHMYLIVIDNKLRCALYVSLVYNK